MLQLYTDTGRRVGTLTMERNRHVKHALTYDEKTLYFEYPTSGPYADQLREEAYVRTKDDEFVIKAVEGTAGDGWVRITANMNVEGIENCTFAGGFEAVEKTMREVLELALAGSDWHVGNEGPSKRRTIRKEDDCNAWDVLTQCVSTYRAEIALRTLDKTIEIYEHRGSDRGVHFMEGINLKQLDYAGDSYDFFTEILPIGKDGLTLMDDPNDPVLILANHTYSRKRVRRIWRDERYTQVASLREDALAKLEEASHPMKSYRVSVKALEKGRDDHAQFFRYGIGDTITLVSKSRRIKEKQRVVVVDEYDDYTDNVVELNTAAKTFAQVQKSETEAAVETATRLANGHTDDSLEGYTTPDQVEEIVQASEVDLSGYATKNDLTNAMTAAANDVDDAQEAAEAAAQEMANTAEANAKRAFREALADYYTAEATDDAIDDAITKHETTAAATYATKAEVTAAATTAETALEAAQDAAEAAGDKVTGTAQTDETGAVTVALPSNFAAAATSRGYRVWVQLHGTGAAFVSHSDTSGFNVEGPQSTGFDWIAVLNQATPAQENETEETE